MDSKDPCSLLNAPALFNPKEEQKDKIHKVYSKTLSEHLFKRGKIA
jgi:hypothetical protein